jgi:hypothetical protein
LNIRKEKDFKVYAEIARKMLIDRNEKCITLTSCGIAIVNLLKVSSALSQHIPGLHKVSRFIQSKCKTCEMRSKKEGAQDTSESRERVKTFVDNY